jgi:hypothetical protein
LALGLNSPAQRDLVVLTIYTWPSRLVKQNVNVNKC